MAKTIAERTAERDRKREQRLAYLLDAFLYPYIEVSRDQHSASAHGHILLRDGTKLAFGDWKAQLKIAVEDR